MASEERISVLVIDDDSKVLKGTCRLLKAQGYNVAEAQTGKEGLRIAKEIKPDLIVLDVMLPDINGIDLCRLIKADQ